MDVKQLEDLEFDRLMGKTQAYSQPLSEIDLMDITPQTLSFIDRQEENDILDVSQSLKLDNKILSEYMSANEKFNSRCLKMIVPHHKDIHQRLQPPPPPPEPVFFPPEPK